MWSLAKIILTKPEQSAPRRSDIPPQRYGSPRKLRAIFANLERIGCAVDSSGRTAPLDASNKLKARNKIVACLSISDLPTKFVCLTQIWRAKPFHPWQCLTANSRLTKVFSRRRFLNQRQSYLLTIRTRGMRGGAQSVGGARMSCRLVTTCEDS